MIVKQDKLLSSDGTTELALFRFLPEGGAEAVVQICHGMSEYSERYTDFASFLTEKGIAVFSLDYPGHGKSIGENGVKGHIGKGKALDLLVRDHALLTDTVVRKTYRHLPLVLYGHSMGSFVARKYIKEYSDKVDGVIISGTSGPDTPAWLGSAIASVVGFFKKETSPSPLIARLAFMGYNKKFARPVKSHSWLSSVDEVVDAYENDPLCGFPFTAPSFRQMFDCIKEVNSDDWFDNVPLSLPMLLVSGSLDPVGNYGRGPKTIFDKLTDRELSDLSLKIYEGCRHEVHNEFKKEEVYADMLSFIERVKDGKRADRMQAGYFGGNFGTDSRN